MRISDWSSDVCSSDLAADIELVVDDPRAAVDVAADRRIHPDVAARTRHALGVEVARDGTRTLAVSKLTEDAANDHGLALVDRALAADRSEEHTSELPSLMPISYSVFGLKKKQCTMLQTQQ